MSVTVLPPVLWGRSRFAGLAERLAAEDEAEITAQLDRTYAEPTDSALPPELKSLPARILEKEDW